MTKKILHFIYGLHTGGAETFVSNLLSILSSDKYEIHIALQDINITNQYIKNQIDVLGGSIHYLPCFPTNVRAQYRQLQLLLEEKHFDFVHIHVNAMVNPVPLIACRKTQTKVVIHSHNTNSNGGFIGRLLHFTNRNLFIDGRHQHFIACSELAGKWMFGKKSYQIVNNAVDLHRLGYSFDARQYVRDSYGIASHTTVLGTVGRLTPQKNHQRIIEIFQEFHRRHNNSVLMIVGGGPMRNELESYVNELHLTSSVIFCGNQPDPVPYYSAMDCFLMPSLFEGLAFTAIEAQANGLPIIVSTALSSEVFQTKYIIPESLDSNNDIWVTQIESILRNFNNDDRIQRSKAMEHGAFDLSSQAESYKKLYS